MGLSLPRNHCHASGQKGISILQSSCFPSTLTSFPQFDLFKVDQRFILRRNCKVFMALQARGPKGFPEREDWENEFMRGWYRTWPIFWEDECVDHRVSVFLSSPSC